MSPRFVLGRENVPCVAEVVNRSLKADCIDFTLQNIYQLIFDSTFNNISQISNRQGNVKLEYNSSFAVQLHIFSCSDI